MPSFVGAGELRLRLVDSAFSGAFFHEGQTLFRVLGGGFERVSARLGLLQIDARDIFLLKEFFGAIEVCLRLFQLVPSVVESDLRLDRNAAPDLGEEQLDSRDGCLDFEDVLRCLDQ